MKNLLTRPLISLLTIVEDIRITTQNYDIFISYNKADIEFSQKLVEGIESEIHQEKPLRCFYASWDIEPGENILLKIEKALQNSRYFGLIISPEWLKSDWTTLERVIPVYDDPSGLKGKIIPILRRNCEIPPSIRILKWLDFRTDSNFKREFRKLINKIKGISPRTTVIRKGDFHDNKPVDIIDVTRQSEVIVSNLFQIVELPKYVNRAKSVVKKRSDVWSMLGEGVTLPVFTIRSEVQSIYCFSPLSDPQQKITQLLQDQQTELVDTKELLNSNLYPVLIDLLNRSMTAHMQNLGMVYDWRNKKTFFPLEKENDEIRNGSWKIGGREYSRFLVKKHETGEYYIHRSCKATFTRINGYLFLKILPGWHFTLDGIRIPISRGKMGSLSARWMNIQRNHSVLDDVRFWINKLSNGNEYLELDVASTFLVKIATVPLSSEVEVGIEGDYRERTWLEEPSEDETEFISIEDEQIDEEEEEYE